MKMAKANQNDLEVAMKLYQALEQMIGRNPSVPSAVEKVGPDEDEESFDPADREQCVRSLGYLLDLADSANLLRVAWGCAVMLDPINGCVDPDIDVIDLHPNTKAGIQVRQAQTISDWNQDLGPVLWWKFPVTESAYFGTPSDDKWPGYHTHWTPIITPNQPTENEMTAV